jgi:hypothetical protein
MAKVPTRGNQKKDDDSEDIVDSTPRSRTPMISQGLRGAVANTTRRERMDREFPAQPEKEFKKGGRVRTKPKGRKK